MATIQISYDLNRPGKDYNKLINRIKQLSGTWCHPLDSLWFIKIDATAVQVRDDLLGYSDSSDALLVMDVSGDGAAWSGLSTEASNWLRANL